MAWQLVVVGRVSTVERPTGFWGRNVAGLELHGASRCRWGEYTGVARQGYSMSFEAKLEVRAPNFYTEGWKGKVRPQEGTCSIKAALPSAPSFVLVFRLAVPGLLLPRGQEARKKAPLWLGAMREYAETTRQLGGVLTALVASGTGGVPRLRGQDTAASYTGVLHLRNRSPTLNL